MPKLSSLSDRKAERSRTQVRYLGWLGARRPNNTACRRRAPGRTPRQECVGPRGCHRSRVALPGNPRQHRRFASPLGSFGAAKWPTYGSRGPPAGKIRSPSRPVYYGTSDRVCVMTTMAKDTASQFILDNFELKDRLAVVLIDRRSGVVTQRIASVSQIVSQEFQVWLESENRSGRDFYIDECPR